jgi:hypothetical protein
VGSTTFYLASGCRRLWPLVDDVTLPGAVRHCRALEEDRGYLAASALLFSQLVAGLIRPICITILYHNLLLFIDIFHI